MTPRQRARAVGIVVAAIAAVVTVAYLLLSGSSDYKIHARFVNAGQLVKGNFVEVGGRPIGKVSDLRLTNDNQADVVLTISDAKFKPLRKGTIATIRQVGLAGIANRFVELTPGPPRAPAIPGGGVLPAAQTRPIVDLDAFLDAIDPQTRAHLQGILRNGSQAFAGTSRRANQAFGYLNPAAAQSAGLLQQLLRDRASLRRLVATSATVAAALASRQVDLEQGVSNTARALRAVAGERSALVDALGQAPAVLVQATGTLHRLRGALSVVNPALREAQPTARPLVRVLRGLGPVSRRLTPVVADVRTLLPSLKQGLEGLPPLADVALPALRSTTRTVGDALPVFTGLRPYAPDLIAGFINGFNGTQAGYYDANGHYARILAMGGGGTAAGAVSPPLSLNVPGLANFRTGITARCPGGAVEPGPDGSNPWIPDPTLCDPAHNHP
ncbi:MAG TPA: MlaD family protein [Solirubrobacteraceae bacterium]|nr:MlaD family protein [Solirubrobacteraceae bacterium]